MYQGLDFDRNELREAMRSAYADLLDFITIDAFQKVFYECMKLHDSERPRFVSQVLLNEVELTSRGVKVPDGILIQRSAFGDRRPTLFVVKKFLPEKFHKAWENVNWTFNNDFREEDVPNDPESSWRLPLRVDVQSRIISERGNLQEVLNNDPTRSHVLA
ncbi:hypothetical protein [uncultured Jannaschia sp.]|uniref:hypothetical protein n=1 Tax=uncultured Jannaschia sp. TaxID=293347 RepID=UPI0026105DA9|nr:hypothetical protein [uncultured Jannaschia sp.]